MTHADWSWKPPHSAKPKPKKKPRNKRKRQKEKRLPDDFYSSWEWAELRYEALKVYGAKCMLCGATSQTNKIVVDHVKSRKLYPELALEFSNLQVLCDMCNRGKGRYDQTDWRDMHADADAHFKSI